MSEGPKKRSLLKQATMQVSSGGVAGFVEVCIMHPLDLVKTRLQLQTGKSMKHVTKADKTLYRGVFDCLHKMYLYEGVFAFWKGILPPIFVETPKRGVKFLVFEQSKRFFMFGADKPTPLTFTLSGLTAGCVESFVVNPFEVVKVTMQANKAHFQHAPSTFAVSKEIIMTEGFGRRGLYKGITSTVARNGVFGAVYFGFYHSVKGFFPEQKEPVTEFLRKAAIGFTAGTLASCANIPFDVAKSRIQGPQPVAGQIKYRSCLQSMALVSSEEGWRALYKGLLPKVMRLGPGGAIMLIVFDYMYEFLQEKFPD